MAKVLVQLPEGLGLTDDEIRDLQRKLARQLVDSIHAEAEKTQETTHVKAKSKSETDEQQS